MCRFCSGSGISRRLSLRFASRLSIVSVSKREIWVMRFRWNFASGKTATAADRCVSRWTRSKTCAVDNCGPLLRWIVFAECARPCPPHKSVIELYHMDVEWEPAKNGARNECIYDLIVSESPPQTDTVAGTQNDAIRNKTTRNVNIFFCNQVSFHTAHTNITRLKLQRNALVGLPEWAKAAMASHIEWDIIYGMCTH